MKILLTDNFDRDYRDFEFIAENIKDKKDGDVMVNALNERFSGPDDPHYYRLVEDDYKLDIFEP